MKIFRDIDQIEHLTNAVATMGSFDGVHCGHQELLRRTTTLARQRGGESVVITFEPHPRYVLGTGGNMKLLTTLDEKLYLFERAGVDCVVVINFTQEFSYLSPQEFIAKIASLGVRCMVVGYNHRFGHKKEGDYNYLESRCEDMELHLVEQQQMAQSKVSSTIIRQQISMGMLDKAIKMMNHPYIIKGTLSPEGTLGGIYPEKLLPAEGVYDATIGDMQTSLTVGRDGSLRVGYSKICGEVMVEIK